MKVRKRPNRLRVFRAEYGITQIALAVKVGLSQTRYWRIENGYDQPTPEERAKLAKVLQTTEDELWPPRTPAAPSTEATA